MPMSPRVFTIPAHEAFLEAFARGLLERFPEAEALARATLFLPSPRACEGLQRILLAESNAQTELIPKMIPISLRNEDEAFLTANEPTIDPSGAHSEAELEALLRPSPLFARRLLFARLVVAQRPSATSATDPAVRAREAFALAAELEKLLDEMESEGLKAQEQEQALKQLVPERFAANWQESLLFLQIITHHLPAIERERGLLVGERRQSLLRGLQIRALKAAPAAPVIVAGTASASAALAEFIHAVLQLEGGELVLPGLDTQAAKLVWDEIEKDAVHPQHGMAKLLRALKTTRAEVKAWPAPSPSKPPRQTHAVHLRSQMAHCALAPASLGFSALPDPLPDRAALQGAFAEVSFLEAESEEREARSLALLLREALEHDDHSVEARRRIPPARLCAALVTPSRSLARRVEAELQRWDIVANDSGGTPLSLTPAGIFLRLTLEAVEARWSPLTLIAVLQHPFARLGCDGETRARIRRTLDAEVRGAKAPCSLDALRRHLRARAEAEKDPGKRKRREEIAVIIEAVARAEAPLAKLLDAQNQTVHGPLEALRAHAHLADVLAASPPSDAGDTLAANPLGGRELPELQRALQSLRDAFEAECQGQSQLPARWYGPALRVALDETVYRPPWGSSRIAILGHLEARLVSADLLILGGLNEGTWPRNPSAGPWLGRTMRRELELPDLECSIGRSAHDFTQAFAAPRVVLSWSQRLDNSPALPSRWVLRLQALEQRLGFNGQDDPLFAREKKRIEPWLRALDVKITNADPVSPAPVKITPTDFPQEVWVTAVETLRKNPYQFFAQRILKLREPSDIEPEISPAVWGIFVHEVLETVQRDEQIQALLRQGDTETALERAQIQATAVQAEFTQVEAQLSLRRPRLNHILRWCFDQEARSRDNDLQVEVEKTLRREANGFTLLGRADRIEHNRDGTFVRIIDHKTGAPPTSKAIFRGEAPQLPLLAALFQAPNARAAACELEYWRLRGQTAGAGTCIPLRPRGDDKEALLREAQVGNAMPPKLPEVQDDDYETQIALAGLRFCEWERTIKDLSEFRSGERSFAWGKGEVARDGRPYDWAWRCLAREWS